MPTMQCIDTYVCVYYPRARNIQVIGGSSKLLDWTEGTSVLFTCNLQTFYEVLLKTDLPIFCFLNDISFNQSKFDGGSMQNFALKQEQKN